jgi:ribosomal protein L40E
MSRVCSSCETENVDEAKFCKKCGGKNFKKEYQSKDVAINNKMELNHTSSEIKNISNISINNNSMKNKAQEKLIFLLLPIVIGYIYFLVYSPIKASDNLLLLITMIFTFFVVTIPLLAFANLNK